jgi:UDP-N-acetylmuramoyl-tripeptide--D-alanyl-D-alanine ligase
MIRAMTLSELAPKLKGEMSFGDCSFDRVSTDSRTLQGGEFFVALKGESFDAHDFLPDVVAAGVCGILLETENQDLGVPQLKVADTDIALGEIASASLSEFEGQVLAITGSGGKTTVKDLSSAILGEVGAVHATRGNYNNEIGVPISVLAMPAGNDYLVLELGASAPGDIAYLRSMVNPDVVLVNNILPAHIEGFGSLAGVIATKAEIYQDLKSDAQAVVNLDLDCAAEYLGLVANKRVLGFSLADTSADFYATDVLVGELGSEFTLNTPLGAQRVKLQLMGTHNIANALAACACTYAMGAKLKDMKVGLEAYDAVPGRMQLVTGHRGSRVIDDTYNANPGAVRAAIDVLVGFSGQTSLVLGDMGELGENEKTLHAELGTYAKQAGVNRLLTVGVLSKEASESFGAEAYHFEDKQSAINFLSGELQSADVVLVKGSRSARMEELVQAITGHGEKQ